MDFEHFLVALGSRKAVVAACRALPGSIPPQNPIENRCKALEIVGRQPPGSFRAAGALCRQPGAPQASQAGAGEGRWILGGFGRVWTGSGSSPQRPVAIRGARYTWEIDLALRKPLEDILFIIQYHCAAAGRPQTSPIVTNPVTDKMYRVLLQNETPLPNWDSDYLPLEI